MGIVDVKKKRGRPTKRPPESELAAMYQLHTVREIANQLGVQPATVKGWVYQYRRGEEVARVD